MMRRLTASRSVAVGQELPAWNLKSACECSCLQLFIQSAAKLSLEACCSQHKFCAFGACLREDLHEPLRQFFLIMLCTGLLHRGLENRSSSCLRCIVLCGGCGSCHTDGRVLTATTSIKRLLVYFLAPSGHVSWEERCAADAVYKFSRLLNPIETSTVSIGVVLAPAAQTALARRA